MGGTHVWWSIFNIRFSFICILWPNCSMYSFNFVLHHPLIKLCDNVYQLRHKIHALAVYNNVHCLFSCCRQNQLYSNSEIESTKILVFRICLYLWLAMLPDQCTELCCIVYCFIVVSGPARCWYRGLARLFVIPHSWPRLQRLLSFPGIQASLLQSHMIRKLFAIRKNETQLVQYVQRNVWIN